MSDQITERDYLIEKLKQQQQQDLQLDATQSTNPEQTENNTTFEQFLSLRKKLRRSIFRGEEVSICLSLSFFFFYIILTFYH